MNLNFLTTAEKKKIRKAVEKELSRYQIYKSTIFIRREIKNTPSYEPRFHGPTNRTIDQTSTAAVYNVDEERRREAFINKVELAVERLPEKERFLIKQRYISKDSQYITDIQMYSFIMDSPISEKTYSKIRINAMVKLALFLDIECGVDSLESIL